MGSSYGGYSSGGEEYFAGILDDVRVYNYARTPKQIVQDMNAGHPAVGSSMSVGYWKFDEGYSTTTHDNTPNANDLTFSPASPSWINDGKFGKAWHGTGSNWLTHSDDNDFDFSRTDDFPISAWIRSSSGTPSDTQYIV